MPRTYIRPRLQPPVLDWPVARPGAGVPFNNSLKSEIVLIYRG